MQLDDLPVILKSKEYLAAEKDIAILNQRLAETNLFLVKKVISDADAFFSNLKKTSPRVYEIVKIQETGFRERVFNKLNGKHIVLG